MQILVVYMYQPPRSSSLETPAYMRIYEIHPRGVGGKYLVNCSNGSN